MVGSWLSLEEQTRNLSSSVAVPPNTVKPFPLHEVYFPSLVKLLVGLAKGKNTWPKIPWPYPACRYALLNLSSIVNNLKQMTTFNNREVSHKNLDFKLHWKNHLIQQSPSPSLESTWALEFLSPSLTNFTHFSYLLCACRNLGLFLGEFILKVMSNHDISSMKRNCLEYFV